MKKIFRMMVAAIVVVLMAACGKSATPEGAAKAFLKDYQKGNYAAMVDQMHFNKELSADDKAQFSEALQGKIGPEIEKKGGIDSFDLGEVEAAEDGQSAKVNYTLHFGNGTDSQDNLKLINIDGNWMVDAGK